MTEHEIKQELVNIAQKHLGVDTLVTRNSDSQDFYDGVAVWDIDTALRSAFELGRKCK